MSGQRVTALLERAEASGSPIEYIRLVGEARLADPASEKAQVAYLGGLRRFEGIRGARQDVDVAVGEAVRGFKRSPGVHLAAGRLLDRCAYGDNIALTDDSADLLGRAEDLLGLALELAERSSDNQVAEIRSVLGGVTRRRALSSDKAGRADLLFRGAGALRSGA